MSRLSLARFFTHLLHTPLATRRAFPPSVQERIRQEIADGEKTHRGEIRFVVEGDWPLADLLAGKDIRDRALEVFGLARVWDTRENSGLLIYILLCEHRVEVLADRGLHGTVDSGEWEGLCTGLTAAFRQGNFEAGSVEAVAAANRLLSHHFPALDDNPNELPDMPIVLR